MPQFPTTQLLHLFGKRAVRRSLIGVGGLLLLYSLLGFVALPAIVKSQAQKMVAEKLHRQLTLGAVEFNPFSLELTLRELRLMEPQGDTLFAAFDAVTLNLSTESVWRLAPVVQEVRLSKPYVRLLRKDAHHYNVDDIIALISAQPPSPQPARFSINNIRLEQGRIEFDDRPAKATHVVSDLTIGVPFISSLPSQVQVFVEPLLSAKVNDTPLLIKGKARPFADPRDAVMEFRLDDLDLTRYLDYLPSKPRVTVAGARLDLQVSASFRQAANQPPALLLNGDAKLKAVRVTEPDGKPLLKLAELAVQLRDANPFGARIDVARVAFDGLEADLVREGDNRLNLLRALPAPAAPAAPAAPPAATPNIVLGEVDIRNAALRYTDQYAPRPMQAGVEKFDLALRRVVIDTRKKSVGIGELASAKAAIFLRQDKAASSAAAAPAAVEAQAGGGYAIDIGSVDIRNWSARLEDRSQAQPAVTMVAPLSLAMQRISTASASPARMELKATVNQTGQLAASGSIGLAPLQADLALDLKGVDMLPLQPYVADRINLRLTRASVSGKGKLQLARADGGALKGGFKGDLALGDLATVDKLSGNDFLRWKSLAAGGIDLRLQPFSLAIDKLALSDFFARVIVDAGGRINLQDIMRGHPSESRSLTEAAPVASSAAPSGVNSAAPARTSAAPPIAIRKLTLQGGRVRFTDNFIKPNYTARLSDFGGTVADLSSDAASSARVDLHGEVNNAPLSVVGRINPLKGDLFLDVKANVRGMELAPLSAYSGRYVGYGIEKGKLSFEVAYHVDQRKLSAENRLVLEQLTFGDRVESASATTLPVRFAVALLSDRNGVIDINLPIGGSLDDPQFSMGSVILKVIGNFITKAVTQPFAMLGALFGGGSEGELSSLEFDAGRASIRAAGEEKLKSLAKALTERPALKLDIAGRADPATDLPGLKRVAIERKLRALKMKDLAARGVVAEPGSVTVNTAEYPALLARAYKDENFAKPRNLIGLPKSLPVEEMEKLMLANVDVDDDDLIALGNQRALNAKSWLLKNGQVPDERIFILAARLAGKDEKGAPGRVDFSLH